MIQQIHLLQFIRIEFQKTIVFQEPGSITGQSSAEKSIYHGIMTDWWLITALYSSIRSTYVYLTVFSDFSDEADHMIIAGIWASKIPLPEKWILESELSYPDHRQSLLCQLSPSTDKS